MSGGTSGKKSEGLWAWVGPSSLIQTKLCTTELVAEGRCNAWKCDMSASVTVSRLRVLSQDMSDHMLNTMGEITRSKVSCLKTTVYIYIYMFFCEKAKRDHQFLETAVGEQTSGTVRQRVYSRKDGPRGHTCSLKPRLKLNRKRVQILNWCETFDQFFWQLAALEITDPRYLFQSLHLLHPKPGARNIHNFWGRFGKRAISAGYAGDATTFAFVPLSC